MPRAGSSLPAQLGIGSYPSPQTCGQCTRTSCESAETGQIGSFCSRKKSRSDERPKAQKILRVPDHLPLGGGGSVSGALKHWRIADSAPPGILELNPRNGAERCASLGR